MALQASQRYRVQFSPATPQEAVATLSVRESQVAFWLAEGKSNRDIGAILDISCRTVERHVENILRKLGLENRTSAAVVISAHLRQQL